MLCPTYLIIVLHFVFAFYISVLESCYKGFVLYSLKVGFVLTVFAVACPFLYLEKVTLYTALPSNVVACSRCAFSLKYMTAWYSLK